DARDLSASDAGFPAALRASTSVSSSGAASASARVNTGIPSILRPAVPALRMLVPSAYNPRHTRRFSSTFGKESALDDVATFGTAAHGHAHGHAHEHAHE